MIAITVPRERRDAGPRGTRDATRCAAATLVDCAAAELRFMWGGSQQDSDMTTPRKTWSVLMVDDNPAMREAIARSLARRGCAVTTATDAAEALASLRRQSCDVVVTDLNMPEHGGLWLWRQAMIVRPELRGRFVLIAS